MGAGWLSELHFFIEEGGIDIQTSQQSINNFENENIHPLDEITLKHQSAVAVLCVKLGVELGLKDPQLNHLIEAAKIHDIGKMGVSQSILDKKEKLDDYEIKQIKAHSIIGYNMCNKLNVCDTVSDLVKYHHEKLDGTGYPEGLKDTEISTSMKILAVADVYDALTAERQYKPKMSHEKALSIMREDFKNHLDQNILLTLDNIIKRENEISSNPSISQRLYMAKKISFATERSTIKRLSTLILNSSKPNDMSIQASNERGLMKNQNNER